MDINSIKIRALVLFAGAVCAPLISAQNSILVTTTNDLVNVDAAISLREAFDIANTDGEASEITLAAESVYVLDLCGSSEDNNASGDLDATESNTLTVQGSGSTINMQCAGEGVIHKPDGPGNIVLQDVVLMGGNVAGGGAALYVENFSATSSSVSLVNVTASANQAGSGAAIATAGSGVDTLTIVDSNLSNNTGSAIMSAFDSVTTVQDSVLSNNLTGSGIQAYDGKVFVINSQITNNGEWGISTTGNGDPNQTITVTSSQISNNELNGIICSSCAGIEIADSTIAGNGETGVVFRIGFFGNFDSFINVEDSELSSNGALTPVLGGAIAIRDIDDGAQHPELHITNSTLANNTAVRGGGLYVEAGNASLDGVTVQGNTAQSGGGIFVVEPGEFADDISMVTIGDSVISGNTASGDGGGVALGYSEVEITGSMITDNVGKVGGGLYADALADVSLNQTTFDNNTGTVVGSGIANYEGLIKVNRCAILGGQGESDAIDSPGGVLEIVNSTIAHNSGRGIHVTDFGVSLPAPLQVLNSTIVYNGQSGRVANGGGVAIDLNLNSREPPGGLHQIRNTIIAGNIASTQPDCQFGGEPVSQGYNVVAYPMGCGLLQGSDQTGDPGLAAFSDDGTAGNGHYLLAMGSKAIDGAGVCPPSMLDQLGEPRPQGVACDIGAIESSSDVLNVVIDVTPGSKHNSLSTTSRAAIWVAVISDANPNSLFDPVAQINIPTVTFGPAQTTVVEHSAKDFDHDGIADLLLRFSIVGAGFSCGDKVATLLGQTHEGVAFGGTDSIKIVGCQ